MESIQSLTPHGAVVVCVLAVVALGTRQQALAPVDVYQSPEDGLSRADRPEPDPNLPIDPSAATEEQLDTLPGVGPALAARIVAHRVAHGPFRSLEAFDAVPGVGPKMLERLAPRLVFHAAPPVAAGPTAHRREAAQ